MKRNQIIGVVVALLIVGGGAFYGGMTYAKSQTPARGAGFAGGTFTRGTGTGAAGARTGAAGGVLTTGQIISQSSGSVTVKMADGSTKIVLVGSSTQIMKQASGSLSDLSVGTNVVVTGSANSDGSMTAQSVQIRPAGAAPIGGAPAQTSATQ